MKPETVLLESKDQDKIVCKITDFGFSKFFDPREGMTETLGSPLYMAPEIIKKIRYDMKVDIWSLGVIIYTLIIGKPPFETTNVKSTYDKIRKNSYHFPEHPVDAIVVGKFDGTPILPL